MEQKEETRKNSVEALMALYGGLSGVATKMKVDRQLVYSWRSKGYIPAKYAYEIEQMTGKKVTAAMVIEDVIAAQGRATSAKERQGK